MVRYELLEATADDGASYTQVWRYEGLGAVCVGSVPLVGDLDWLLTELNRLADTVKRLQVERDVYHEQMCFAFNTLRLTGPEKRHDGHTSVVEGAQT